MAYTLPDESSVRAFILHDCEVECGSECSLACPYCGQVIGFDGYCDDAGCPNYKGGAMVANDATDQDGHSYVDVILWANGANYDDDGKNAVARFRVYRDEQDT